MSERFKTQNITASGLESYLKRAVGFNTRKSQQKHTEEQVLYIH